jgi:hypothetical protein
MPFQVLITPGTLLYLGLDSYNACSPANTLDARQTGTIFGTFPYIELSQVFNVDDDRDVWELSVFVTTTELRITNNLYDRTEAHLNLSVQPHQASWSSNLQLRARNENGTVYLPRRYLDSLRLVSAFRVNVRAFKEFATRARRVGFTDLGDAIDPDAVVADDEDEVTWLDAVYNVEPLVEAGILTEIDCAARANPQMGRSRARANPSDPDLEGGYRAKVKTRSRRVARRSRSKSKFRRTPKSRSAKKRRLQSQKRR